MGLVAMFAAIAGGLIIGLLFATMYTGIKEVSNPDINKVNVFVSMLVVSSFTAGITAVPLTAEKKGLIYPDLIQ